MTRWVRATLLAVAFAGLVLVSPSGRASGTEKFEPAFSEDADVHDVIGPDAEFSTLQAEDPLGLLLRVDTLREHSLGEDRIDVWVCDIEETPQEVMEIFDQQIEPWFQAHSRGRYEPIFSSRGQGCIEDASQNPSPGANAAVIVGSYAGGSSQILTCRNGSCADYETFPSNYRYSFVGISRLGANAVHEIGHLIRWMHSYSGQSGSQYDNAADVMSGNYGIGELGSAGTYPLPYGTAAINRYAAGWIDPVEIAVVDGNITLTLSTSAGDKYQMAVIEDGNSFYTLDARIPGGVDPIPEVWAGVALYRVTPEAFPDGIPGFRRVSQHPAIPFNPADFSAYEEPLESILGPGQSITVAGTEVTVVAAVDNGFRVQFGEGHDGTFLDDDGSTFEADIEWLAAEGVTKGCNPPINDRYCPDDPVTRGQMAAFLHRALDDVLTPTRSVDFSDDDGNTFEVDIAWLGGTGVTKGCNPPINDRYCPDDLVTRGQMAAFLARALGYTDDGGGNLFIDDDGNTFESDIDRLGTAGVTRGCNPPVNDRFCPNDLVTRGQMAAFLHRALGS